MNLPPPVRLLSHEDAAALAVLHDQCFAVEDSWNAWAFQDTLSLSSTLGLCIEQDARIGAFILLQSTPPEAEILTIAVHPDLRRRGLARTLIQRSCELLAQRGVQRLLLDVAADNPGAVAFYENMQFVADGRRKHYYKRKGGQRVDATLMSRAIAGQLDQSEA